MQKTDSKTRQDITALAARYIAENGSLTYHAAKRKAAVQLGYKKKNLPKNIEIEQAVITYQSLFQKSCQPQALYKLRSLAIDIMKQFKHFNPRLVGSVLAGTAGNHSEITVHLFSNDPETICIHLMEKNIPYESCEKKIRTTGKNIMAFPAFCFLAGHVTIVLIVFPEKHLKHAPICPIDEKLMKRANIEKVESLLQDVQ